MPLSIQANCEPYYQGEWHKQPYPPRCAGATEDKAGGVSVPSEGARNVCIVSLKMCTVTGLGVVGVPGQGEVG